MPRVRAATAARTNFFMMNSTDDPLCRRRFDWRPIGSSDDRPRLFDDADVVLGAAALNPVCVDNFCAQIGEMARASWVAASDKWASRKQKNRPSGAALSRRRIWIGRHDAPQQLLRSHCPFDQAQREQKNHGTDNGDNNRTDQAATDVNP